MRHFEIYFKKEELIKRETEKLNNSKISKTNKNLIRRFVNNLLSKGRSKYRGSKLSAQLRRLCTILNKDLSTAYKEDIENLTAYINTELLTKDDKPASEATKADYRRCIKQFYIWYEPEDERLYSTDITILRRVRGLYRYVTKDIKGSYKDPFHDPSTVLTDSDIRRVLDYGCDTIRDKAIITFLYHTGIRLGELLHIRLKHISINDKYAEVEVYGKTGQRAVWLGNALPYLVQYLEVHPNRHDKESFLWIGESSRYGPEPLRHYGVKLLIIRCFKKARVNKKCNPHWFRHSRATNWALKYSEAVLCQLMGWVSGSKQVRRYVHLGRKEIRKKFLSSLGLINDDKEQTERPIACVCGTSNDSHMRYCFKCGKPLSVGIILEDKKEYDAELNKTVQYLMKIMSDPELLKRFNKFKLKEGSR